MTASRVRAAVTAASPLNVDEDAAVSTYRALVVLARRGPSRTADVAASVGVDWATTTRTCDRPAAHGLVEHLRTPSDRREVCADAPGEPGDLDWAGGL